MSDDEDDNTPLPPMLREDADATLYKYRDFALVLDVDNDCEPSTQNQANRSLESSIRVQKFPVKLYSILAQKEFSDIITWMPHGRSWKVLKPNLFESLVMPLFFEYSNYHSFNRLVNAWSFRRISSGSDRGSYYHEVKLQRVIVSIFDSGTKSLTHILYHFSHTLPVISSRQATSSKVHATTSKDSQETPHEETG